jgi:predicted ATP-grasp superfamily ATP-dependent carboligase
MIRWTDPAPSLRAPAVVAAFEGWNDAGDAATDALRYLVRALDALEIATIDPEPYVDFQVSRPQVEIVNGVVRSLAWPTTRVHAAEVGGAAGDVVLVVGHEPNFHWKGYCNEIIEVARALGGATVVTLGALLADSPHSRPVRVTGTAGDEDTMRRLGLQPSTYEGPTGIVGVLHSVCRDAGFRSVSLWAPVPHYASSAPSPKATRALVGDVSKLLDLPIDLHRIEVAAEAWERQVGELVASDDDVREYVEQLEEQYDSVLTAPDDLPSGDALAAEFQRYLREHGD